MGVSVNEMLHGTPYKSSYLGSLGCGLLDNNNKYGVAELQCEATELLQSLTNLAETFSVLISYVPRAWVSCFPIYGIQGPILTGRAPPGGLMIFVS